MFDVPADSAASYLFTARMLLRQDFSPVAEEYAHKAAELDPKLPLAHELLGEVYLYHLQIDQAIAEFQKELVINPGYPAAYYKLADCYSRVQKFDDAERLLQRSIWLDPTSTGPFLLLGKVLEKKGERNLRCGPCNGPWPWTPIILFHTTSWRGLPRFGNEDADRELKLAANWKKGRIRSLDVGPIIGLVPK